ncbi:hypothetical protein EDB87DRAFT_1684136 [Lactarius vividus]|nr:hypothetical protein EDB87DRAFT_1684136 [Lactarius vividus]
MKCFSTYFVIIWMILHNLGPGSCIHVASGDVSYLRLNGLYIFDCSYGGSPALDRPAPKDEDNIIAALKRSRRISSISLTVTSSLLKELSAIKRSFSELKDLVPLSRDDVRLAFPRAFWRGLVHLRTLHLTRVAIPTLPDLLCSCVGFVDLRLHEIPSVGYFSPVALVSALSKMTELQTLSLHFLSLPDHRDLHRNNISLPPQSGERVVLPALTRLKYRGP